MIEQSAYQPTPEPTMGTNNFAENPENRCPCVLLLDVSGSMAGAPLAELQSALTNFKDCLAPDSLAARRVEVAIVTFGGEAQVVTGFTTAEEFHPPTLRAHGGTPMGAAILSGIELLRRRKDEYKAHGIMFYRPWLFLITDGGPTDEWTEAAAHVKAGEAAKSFLFFSVGVEGANFDVLKQISTREPLKLNGLGFRAMFQWLSTSLSAVSRSNPGDGVPLQNPTGPSGWATTA